MLNTSILNRILKQRNYFYCIAVAALFGTISVKMPVIAILVGFLSIVIFVLKSKFFRNFYLTSTKWQLSYYFIICFAVVFPLLERYYQSPIDFGMIKVFLLTILFSIYIFSVLIGKTYKVHRSIWYFFLIYSLFLVGFLYMLISDIADDKVSAFESLMVFMMYAYYPVIVFFAYNEFKRTKAIENMLNLVLYLAIFMSVVGFFQWFVGPVFLASTGMEIIREGYGGQAPMVNTMVKNVEDIVHFRVFSTLNDHYAYAAFLLLAVVSILYYIDMFKKNRKYIVILALVLFSVISTYSIAALIGISLLLIAFISKEPILEGRIVNKSIFRLFIFLILCFGIIILTGFEERLRSTLTLSSGTLLARSRFFSAGITGFLKNPFGYGFSIRELTKGVAISADCFWLWALLQLGIIVFIPFSLLYIYPMLNLYFQLRHKKRISRGKLKIIYLFFSLLVVNTFFLNFANNLMSTGPSNLIFWSVVGISLNNKFWLSGD